MPAKFGTHTIMQKDIDQLERVQKFALRMCAKQWDVDYTDLLTHFNLPSLANHRHYLSLSTMSVADLGGVPGVLEPPST